MPEMFKAFGDSDNSLSSDSNSWLDSGALSYDVIMSSLNISHDYPDLDDILDARDNDIIVNGGTEATSPAIYDDDYIEDLSHLCSENSEITQQHYKSKINLQPEGLLRNNEDGLLEALRRSMENFESSNLSDLASLSSSLNLACSPNDLGVSPSSNNLFLDDLLMSDQQSLPTAPKESSCIQEEEDVDEEELASVDEQNDEKSNANESMLKQLLLNPNNDYRKEIDSNHDNSECVEKSLGSIGSSHENKRNGRKLKKKKLPQKPFTELLKHLGTTNNRSSQTTPKPKTRVLNAKKYLRQYGSAPTSRVGSPDPDPARNLEKKTPIKPSSQRANGTKSSRNSRLINPKKPLQVTKVYPITQASVAGLKPIKGNDENLNEISFQPSSAKRKGTVLIEPLPKKRQRQAAEEAHKKKDSKEKLCHQQPNPDHDYCQKFSFSQVNGNSVPEGTVNPNKVVQWEEYLQHVRSGTRSAPNSPAGSPKPIRSSSRKSSCGKTTNNLKRSNLTIAQNQSATFASPHVTPIIAAKIQANTKPTIKLQEFQEYLANLKNKRHPNKTSSSSAEIVAPPGSVAPRNTVRIVQTSSAISSTALSLNLANQLPVVQQSKPIAPSQPFIKVQSGGKIHTAAVTSAHTLPHPSGPVVMIRIPTQSSTSITGGLLQQNFVSTVSSSPVPKTSPSSSAPKATAPKIKRVVANPKTANRFKKSTAQSTQTGTKLCKNPIPNLTSPTFKLITSSKGGGQCKSLILSNVTGQLKDILFALAQQQQGDKTNSSSSEQQQKTLQQLLATITDMKKKQTTINFVPSSNFQPSPKQSTSEEKVTENETVAGHNGVARPALLNERCLNSINPESAGEDLGSVQQRVNCSQSLSLTSLKRETSPANLLQSGDLLTSLEATDAFQTASSDSIMFDDVFFNFPQKCLSRKPVNELSVPSGQSRTFTPVNHYLKSIVSSTVNDLLDRVVDACHKHKSTAVCTTKVSKKPLRSDDTVAAKHQSTALSTSPLSRVAAKAESNSFCSVLDDDGAALSLADILKRSDDEDRNAFARDEVPPTAGEDQYYNKLPAYLYSGKLLVPDKSPRLDGSELTFADQFSTSDGVGCEVELQNIEYNKLPHYFSSGKLAPREEVVSSCDHVIDRQSGVENDSGDMKYTATGRAIEPGDTFYSRLPSYYTCGRAHIVDTVTDPPQHPDEVVTKETLRRQHEESRLKLEEQQRCRVEKRRSHESENIASSDHRILYSKLPSYLLSGRQPLAPDRNSDPIYPSSQSSSSDTDDPTAKWFKEKPSRSRRKNSKKEDTAKNTAILERRVMYVGGIDRTTTKEYLRDRFKKFGAIDDVDLHFRKGKDNYAFVTFRYGNDVVRAIEHGNDEVSPKFILCFGGRRYFCKVDYADLDHEPNNRSAHDHEDDFDTLLQQAMRR